MKTQEVLENNAIMDLETQVKYLPGAMPNKRWKNEQKRAGEIETLIGSYRA